MQAKARIQHTTIELVRGDITHQDTDAIVNAANSSLLGGCQTGDARITKGYNLKARHVIHAVGPVYRRGDPTVAALLASAYQHSLELAQENQLESLAFPSISTGVFGYPVDKAAEIALTTVCDFASSQERIRLIRFVLFDPTTFRSYATALSRLADKRSDMDVLS